MTAAVVPALALALALALGASPSVATAAAPAAAEGEPKAWTLEALQAAAERADPRVLAAAAEVARLRGLEAQVHGARLPALEWTLSGGPIPELQNDPNHLDAVKPVSRLRNGELGSWGVYAHLGANLTWPVYTFGKLGAYEAAAARGVGATAGAAQAARARAARDAAEVYWGYQLGRRGLAALDDADRQLAGARERVEKLVAEGSTHVSKQDLAQLDLVRAELGARRAEATAARDLAIEAGRIVAGVPSDAPFAFAPAALDAPGLQLATLPRYVEAALARRAEVGAAQNALRAREALAQVRRRAFYPDLVAVGFADLNWASSATPQTNPFAWDPYNRLWAGVGLALRGTLDVGRARADVAQAEAEVERARAEADLAAKGVRLEVARAHTTLRAALERTARMRDEEAAARRWLSQAELSFDAGLADAQAVLVAALATARAGTERLSAARDAQLALADLGLAVGEDPRTVK
jgi:outer membrane protein, multidrug efflux system